MAYHHVDNMFLFSELKLSLCNLIIRIRINYLHIKLYETILQHKVKQTLTTIDRLRTCH